MKGIRGFSLGNIRRRLLGSYIFMIVFTMVMMEVFLIGIVQNNYYNNLENALKSQVRYSTELYLKYFSDASLEENVLNNVDTFWKQTNAEVEILNLQGDVMMDSIGNELLNKKDYPDVKEALNGGTGRWIGNVTYDRFKVLSISMPLSSSEGIVGVLRFSVSLEAVNQEVNRLAMVFMIFGAIFLAAMCLLSVVLTNTIVRPLKKVTVAAERMAGGDYTARSEKEAEDEVGKLSDTLNYMAAEIVKKEQLKNDFVSSVSHELRTPLTSIKGWAVTLLHDSKDEEILVSGLEIIEKETDRLSKMVEELLDFSKFVSGKITLENAPVELRELLKGIGRQMSPRAEREGVSITIDIPEEIPETFSDENRLKQVFINLVDNSLKFTEFGGKIHIRCTYREGNYRIWVKDTGVGIDPEELPKIKEKFYKGKTSKSSSGIGLSICDEIISLMGGTMEIESTLGEGTTVILTLPRKEVERG